MPVPRLVRAAPRRAIQNRRGRRALQVRLRASASRCARASGAVFTLLCECLASPRRDELQLARSIISNETHFFSFASEVNKSGKLQYRDLRDQLFSQEQGYWLRGCRHAVVYEHLYMCCTCASTVHVLVRLLELCSPLSGILHSTHTALSRPCRCSTSIAGESIGSKYCTHHLRSVEGIR